MKISPSRKIREFQEDFHLQYGGLKIEFYQDAHKVFEGSHKNQEASNESTFEELVPGFKEINIDLNENQTVAELEAAFETMGLHAQIFRRSNKVWLQTTSTDHWSLQTQNRKGLNSVQ